MKGDTGHVFELRIAQVSRIHLLGGSILQTSRANPTKKPEGSRARRRDARAARHRSPDHDRRRRHRVLGAPRLRAGGRADPRGARAEDHRQRPAAPGRHPDLRLRDGARARHAHRLPSDGGRAHQPALVLRRDDGAHGRPPRARRGEGGGCHARADPRGVPARADPARNAGSHPRGRDREAPLDGARPRRGRDRGGRRRAARSQATSRRSPPRRATSTATCGSPRSRSAPCSATRCAPA